MYNHLSFFYFENMKYKILTFIFAIISLIGFQIGLSAGYGCNPYCWNYLFITWLIFSFTLLILWIWIAIF